MQTAYYRTWNLQVVAGVMAVTAALSACGKNDPAGEAPQTATLAAHEEASAAAPVKPDVPVSPEQIRDCDNMIAWYSLYSDYADSGESAEALDSAFEEKKAELLARKPSIAVNDALEIVAFDWKLNGTSSAEGKPESFTASWLFHKKTETQLSDDQRVVLVLRGWVDKSHQEYLKSDKNPEGRYFEKTYFLDPPLNEWKTGDYTLISHEVRPALPNLPYRMQSIFTLQKKDEAGQWRHDGRFADPVEMGWFADLGQ